MEMKNADSRVMEDPQDPALSSLAGAALVALRWDLIPFQLVLDVDMARNREDSAERRRIWLQFKGSCEITWDLDVSFPAEGGWIISGLSMIDLTDRLWRYEITVELPRAGETAVRSRSVPPLIIEAMQLSLTAASVLEDWPASGRHADPRVRRPTDKEMFGVIRQKSQDPPPLTFEVAATLSPPTAE